MPRLELTGSVYRGQIGAIIAAAELDFQATELLFPRAFILHALLLTNCARLIGYN